MIVQFSFEVLVRASESLGLPLDADSRISRQLLNSHTAASFVRYVGCCAGCNAGRGHVNWGKSDKARQYKTPGRPAPPGRALPHSSPTNTRVCPTCHHAYRSAPNPSSFMSPTKQYVRANVFTPSPTKKPPPPQHTPTRSGHHYTSIPPTSPDTPVTITTGELYKHITQWCDCAKARKECCSSECGQCARKPHCTGSLLALVDKPCFEGPIAKLRVECGACHHTFVFTTQAEHQKIRLTRLGASARTTGHQVGILKEVIAARVGNQGYEDYVASCIVRGSEPVGQHTFASIGDLFWSAVRNVAEVEMGTAREAFRKGKRTQNHECSER